MVTVFTEGALSYAERLGWKLLLLAPGAKVPFFSKGRGGNGVHDATSDLAKIREWGLTCPSGNIGVACGDVSGIAVVDVDPRNGGDATLAALAAKGRVLPPCPCQRTGNGGWHYLFSSDPRIGGSKGKLGSGIEIKSTGGYIVAAPSWIRASKDGRGGAYRWEITPFEVAPPPMPGWMTTLLGPPPLPKPSFRPDERYGGLEPLARFVASSPVGERNNRLYWAACRSRELIARSEISEASVVRRLTDAAAAAGLIGPDAPGALRTILSALKPGAPNA
jgi:Bifunctional DNA primase/polymerase, N-terminal